MCLGIPAQLVDGETSHPDLATPRDALAAPGAEREAERHAAGGIP